jgi:hypothetical protein
VTLVSDRTPEEIFRGRATASAFMFDRALASERELGLNLWDEQVPWGDGIRVEVGDGAAGRTLTLEGRLGAPGQAVDQRLKYAAWLEELERRGGRVEVRAVGRAELDRLAAEHDVACVAAGRGGLAELFERDAARSPHDEPQRQLTLLVLRGVAPPRPERLSSPLVLSISEEHGELLWVPFLDRSGTPCRSLLFEARPGGRMDRFRELAGGEELVRTARAVVADLFPWEEETLAGAELADPLAWARGALTPTVRRPAGLLPSGRAVLGIGDSVVLNDPLASQGANCAARMARFLAGRIDANRGGPYDGDWIEAQFEDFWAEDARYVTALSNLLLEPHRPAVREVLEEASRSSEAADRLADAFDEPQRLHSGLFARGAERVNVPARGREEDT